MKEERVMNMFDFAMEIEDEGVRFYTGLAEKTGTRQMAGIFRFFAREEKRHFEIFEAWKKNTKAPDIDDTDLLGKSVEVFKELSAQFATAGVPALDHEDVYKKALALEEKSITFYNDLGRKLPNEEQRTMVKLILHQEQAHVKLINHLMDFQRHPNEWLENAEWNHRDEY
jgi:rubrerythrin